MNTDTIDWYGFRAYPWNLPEKRKGAYLLTNLVNDKTYVGVGGLSSNTDVWTRSFAHSRSGSPRRLKRSLDKHGRSMFLLQPILYLTQDIIQAELLRIEADLIKTYDSAKYGYNIVTLSVSGAYGPAFGAIISAALNKPGNKEKRSAISRIALNRPEAVERVRAGSIATWKDPVVRKRRLTGMLANWSDETKRDAYIEAMAAGRDNDVYRANLSPASKKHRNDPAEKAAYSALMKSLVWITDGINNKRVLPTIPLPDGWQRGRAAGLFKPGTFDARTAKLASDPDYSRRLSEGQRAGWANDEERRSRASARFKINRENPNSIAEYERTRGSIWITDGKNDTRIRPDESMPLGWRLGRTARRKSSNST